MRFRKLNRNQKGILAQGLVWALVFGGLYLTTLYGDLLFHALAEMFRVGVAVAIFMLVWNVRRSLDNAYFLFVGVAYVFIGALDIIHTLSYQGMGVFPGYGANLPTQLWIAARYLEGLSLFLAAIISGRRLKLGPVLSGYGAATAFLLGSILFWRVFPACFVEGAGPTPFKKVSEYLISLILVASATVLMKKRDRFDPAVMRLLVAAIGFTLVSELSFSFYADLPGLPNLLGHFFKIISFYYIYLAIIKTGIADPLAVLFRNLKKSEIALRGQRDFIEAVLSSEDVMVAVLDREGRVVRMNKASGELTGYSFDEMKGREPWDLIVPGESKELKALLREDVSVPTPIRRENSLVSKDGRLVWVLWSSSFILNEKGIVEYIVISGIDITERKRAEESLRESQSLFQKLARVSPVGIFRTDPGGDCIYVNERWLEIAGMSREQALGRGWTTAIHPDDRDRVSAEWYRSAQNRLPFKLEYRFQRPDGISSWVMGQATAEIDDTGHITGFVGTITDISERKQAEIALHTAYNELETRVQERTRELARTNELLRKEIMERRQIEEALRESEGQLRTLSSRLLTAQETERRRVSRELHDELGGGLAVLKLRLSSIERKLGADQQALREESRQNLQYIDQIIDDVARLSRDLSPSILEDLGLTPALRRLMENFSNNHGVQVASDLTDLGDLFSREAQIMIYRVFQEALTNIGKHAQAKNVTVRVRRDEDRVLFFLEDDGKGFDMKRVSTMKASEKGLGLATMEERARMVGGFLDLKSGPGKGTRLLLSIPLSKKEGVR